MQLRRLASGIRSLSASKQCRMRTSSAILKSCRCSRSPTCLRRVASSATGPEHLGWGRQLDPVAAYVHLPFCKRKCYYCDFPVVAVGMDAEKQVVHDKFQKYMDTLDTEIRSHARLNAQPLRSVYIGGGTPSLLPPKRMQELFDLLQQRFGIADDAEVTLEADPGTFDAQKLRDYMSTGVTRFSVGVQSFDEDLLTMCGRAHTLADVYSAVDALHDAKPSSWSLDLISGLPSLTPSQWLHSVSEGIRMQPTHISTYDLQIEQGTPFERWNDTGKLSLPLEDDAADMLQSASQAFKGAGFEHYEVSNYAKPGHRCLHNQVYWHGQSYYAFGLGAASYLQGHRYSRPKDMLAWRAYVADVQSMHPQGDYVASSLDPVAIGDQMLECIMLQLRLRDGLPLRWFGDTFGKSNLTKLLTSVRPHLESGLAYLWRDRADESHPLSYNAVADECDQNDMDPKLSLCLSDPDGLLVSNSIISDAFAALDTQEPHSL